MLWGRQWVWQHHADIGCNPLWHWVVFCGDLLFVVYNWLKFYRTWPFCSLVRLCVWWNILYLFPGCLCILAPVAPIPLWNFWSTWSDKLCVSFSLCILIVFLCRGPEWLQQTIFVLVSCMLCIVMLRLSVQLLHHILLLVSFASFLEFRQWWLSCIRFGIVWLIVDYICVLEMSVFFHFVYQFW